MRFVAALAFLVIACTSQAPPPSVGGWRLVEKPFTQDAVAIAWCPAETPGCEVWYGPVERGRFTQVTAGEGGLRLFHATSAAESANGRDVSCEVVFCVNDEAGHYCRADEVTCNANSGTLTALPSGTVLYRGGAGSGVSAARLYDERGLVLWTSLHVADELSSSRRYLLVGGASSGTLFAPIDTMTVVDLRNGEAVAQVEVPADTEVRATWGGQALRLVWRGGEKRVVLDEAGQRRAR
jgi:hypothetical protein